MSAESVQNTHSCRNPISYQTKQQEKLNSRCFDPRLWWCILTVGRTETALGAFYRRLSARIGKAKGVTATARKIGVLFYNTLRHGMDYVDPGAAYYEERYRNGFWAVCGGAPSHWDTSGSKQ